MNRYIIQVKAREETRYIERFNKTYGGTPLKLTFLQRQLDFVRHGQKAWEREEPLFPGYVFAESAESGIDGIQWKHICGKVKGFIRVLNRMPLRGRDLGLTELLMKTAGESGVLGASSAYFDEDDRIVIISGALKGLEGNIVKVDRRRKRVKAKLELYENGFAIDFSFNEIKKQ